MEATIYDSITLMDTTPVSPDAPQFLPASIQCPSAIPAMPALDAFSSLPDPSIPGPMLPPVPYMPPAPIAPFNDYPAQYPMMDQASDLDVLSRPPPQMQPPSAAIHGPGASYNLNNTSSLASALDPGGVAPASRSRANTLTSQSLPPFAVPTPVVSFAPVINGDDAQVKQEDVPKERVVGNMLRRSVRSPSSGRPILTLLTVVLRTSSSLQGMPAICTKLHDQ